MGSPVIFFGDAFRALRNRLLFFNDRSIESGLVNPTIVATDGAQGSLYLGSSGLYRKNDTGVTINWSLIGGSSNPTVAQLINDGAANVNLTGLDLDETVDDSVIIEATIYRKADVGERLMNVQLVAQYNNSSWFLGRRDTVVLDGDPSGVTFNITAAGQVQYSSDLMGAGYDLINSRIRYLITNFSIGT